jgi:hypothetical protein
VGVRAPAAKACAKPDFLFCPCKALHLIHSRVKPPAWNNPHKLRTRPKRKRPASRHPGFDGTGLAQLNSLADRPPRIQPIRSASHSLIFARCIMLHATIICSTRHLAACLLRTVCGQKQNHLATSAHPRIPPVNAVVSVVCRVTWSVVKTVHVIRYTTCERGRRRGNGKGEGSVGAVPSCLAF